MNYWNQVLWIAFLLVLSGFFAAAETALFSLTAIQRRRVEAKYRRRGRIVKILLDHPRRTLLALLIGNYFVNTLASTIVAVIAVRHLGLLGVGLTIFGFTALLVFWGEIVPKTIAIRSNEEVSAFIAYPLHYFAKMIVPLRRLVRWATDKTLSFLVREKTGEKEVLSGQELQTLIEIVQEEGVLDEAEGKRLQRLFELEGRSVKEIMTPRTELVGFDIEKTREDLVEIVQKYHYTYMPVYRETLDHILGVIATQEFMLFPEKGIQELLIKPCYIPEMKRIDEVLFEMRKMRSQFVICVDEYGGTAGLTTQEDVMEEIFGEIYDEYAKKETLITKLSKDEFLLDGKIPLKDFTEYFGIQAESNISDTLSGFILEKLGKIPRMKETLRIDNLFMEIRMVDRQRITKIFVRRTF